MTWLNLDNRGVSDYAKAESLWARVRSPKKGKPVTGWLRMYKQDDGDFLFKMVGYGERDLCRLSPDNVLTFVATEQEFKSQAQTLVTSMYRWLPFSTMRHRTGLYRIAGNKPVAERMQELYDADGGAKADPYYGHQWTMYQHYAPVMRQQAYYFQGIQFNVKTGECLNPKPDVKLIEKPEERKQWRRALSLFKKGIKTRVKVHAFDGICNEVWSERDQSSRWDWQQPDWSSKQWLDLLEHCIRHNEFPKELLKGLAQTLSNGYYRTDKPTGKDVLEALEYVCNGQSIELRKRFGVFKEE